MKQNNFGQIVLNESDVFDLIMKNCTQKQLEKLTVESTVDIHSLKQILENSDFLFTWTVENSTNDTESEFHSKQQANWYMPAQYADMDIAAHVLSLCENQEELQRCGQELMLFQEHNLFELLKYLKYLVDVLTENRIVWGVGRGSSVSSFVLYKLGVHRINSLYYNLNINEFLR